MSFGPGCSSPTALTLTPSAERMARHSLRFDRRRPWWLSLGFLTPDGGSRLKRRLCSHSRRSVLLQARSARRRYGAGRLGRKIESTRSSLQREHRRMNDNYFGEDVAARYDGGPMFAPECSARPSTCSPSWRAMATRSSSPSGQAVWLSRSLSVASECRGSSCPPRWPTAFGPRTRRVAST